MTVLITTPSFGQHSREPWTALDEEGIPVRRPKGTHPLSAKDLAEELTGATALITGLDDVNADVLATPGLRVVAKHGVGVDNIDLDAARRLGVRVVNAPGTNTDAVADLTVGLLLTTVRRIVPAHRSLVAGRWDRFFGPQLSGQVLGILGFGRIGQAVARRAHGFGMKLQAHDPFLPDTVFTEHDVVRTTLAECLTTSDILTLHLPPPTDGNPLLGRAELSTVKRGAYLINTARGGLTDEQALADLLHDGHLSGAAVDVFATEPPHDSPLLTAPNTLLTPHIGAYAHEANAAMGTTVARDIGRILRDEDPLNPVV
jgi:D-3-phosphoglycerate dehydrogenase